MVILTLNIIFKQLMQYKRYTLRVICLNVGLTVCICSTVNEKQHIGSMTTLVKIEMRMTNVQNRYIVRIAV